MMKENFILEVVLIRNSPNPATPQPAPSSITRLPLSLDGENLPFLQFFS